MPRTDWKRMRADLARIAGAVGEDCETAGVKVEVTLGGPPPRIFIAMHYPEELHTGPEPAPEEMVSKSKQTLGMERLPAIF